MAKKGAIEGVTNSGKEQKRKPITKKMLKECMVIIALIFATCSTLYALENVSFRIKALGSSLSGIVEDSYTDVLAYPARLSKWKKTTLTGKFGGGDTFNFGLFRKFGLIGETSVYRNLDEDYSEDIYSYYYDLVREYTRVTESDSDNKVYNFVGLIGMDLSNRISIGSNYLYYQDKNSSVSDRDSTTEYVDSDQKTLYIHNNVYVNSSGAYSENHRFAFGLLCLSESNQELDVTFEGALKYDKTTSAYKDYDLYDNDPDGDGKNYGGGSIPTPNKDIYDLEEKSLRKLKKELGGGVQLRYSYQIGDFSTLRFILGGDYQPFDIKGNENFYQEDTDIEGSTTTVTLRQSRSSIVGDRGEINSLGAIGIEKKFGEQILLGIAIRWAGSFVTEDSTKVTAPDSSPQFEEKDKLRIYQHELSLPIGIELSPFRAIDLKFRVGTRGKFSWQSSKETIKNKDTGAIIADLHSKDYDTDIDYTGGIGFVFKDLQLDIYTTTDFISFSQWQLQATIRL